MFVGNIGWIELVWSHSVPERNMFRTMEKGRRCATTRTQFYLSEMFHTGVSPRRDGTTKQIGCGWLHSYNACPPDISFSVKYRKMSRTDTMPHKLPFSSTIGT